MGEEPLELSPEDREWLSANWHYPLKDTVIFSNRCFCAIIIECGRLAQLARALR